MISIIVQVARAHIRVMAYFENLSTFVKSNFKTSNMHRWTKIGWERSSQHSVACMCDRFGITKIPQTCLLVALSRGKVGGVCKKVLIEARESKTGSLNLRESVASKFPT